MSKNLHRLALKLDFLLYIFIFKYDIMIIITLKIKRIFPLKIKKIFRKPWFIILEAAVRYIVQMCYVTHSLMNFINILSSQKHFLRR